MDCRFGRGREDFIYLKFIASFRVLQSIIERRRKLNVNFIGSSATILWQETVLWAQHLNILHQHQQHTHTPHEMRKDEEARVVINISGI